MEILAHRAQCVDDMERAWTPLLPPDSLHSVPCRDEVLATLTTVSDFSYAWGIIDTYTPVLQAQVNIMPSAACTHQGGTAAPLL